MPTPRLSADPADLPSTQNLESLTPSPPTPHRAHTRAQVELLSTNIAQETKGTKRSLQPDTPDVAAQQYYAYGGGALKKRKKNSLEFLASFIYSLARSPSPPCSTTRRCSYFHSDPHLLRSTHLDQTNAQDGTTRRVTTAG